MSEEELVYHYTNSEGLIGILGKEKSTSIRATGVRHLNDQSELYYGAELVVDLLENSRPDLDLDDPRVEYLIRTFKEYTPGDNIFVACFSKYTDFVDQWRGYGENGLGFAIGFSTREIHDVIRPKKSVAFHTCEYDPTKSKKYLTESLNNFFNHIVLLTSISPQLAASKNGLEKFLEFNIRSLIPSLKHAAYEQEREHRLIVDNSPHSPDSLERPLPDLVVGFRSGRRGLIPYTTIDLPAPKVLRVGPSEHQEENYEAAKLLLGDRGFVIDQDIQLIKEKIPYRG